jgi:histidine triad (HIT) family protein
MADCVFCMIRDAKIPSAKVYDDERTLAFMDINPLTRGHCLVVTKAHAATLYDAEVEDLKAASPAKKVPGCRVLNPDGKRAAGQRQRPSVVPHFHPPDPLDRRRQGFDWKPSRATGRNHGHRGPHPRRSGNGDSG